MSTKETKAYGTSAANEPLKEMQIRRRGVLNLTKRHFPYF
jgi:hypothetical protein